MEKIRELGPIFSEISKQNWVTVTNYFKTHADHMMFPLNINGDTVFHLAMYSGELYPFLHLQQIFRSGYPEDEDVFLSRNSKGNTILHEAVAAGNVSVIIHLIDDYPKLIMIENVLGETPLYTAAAYGHMQIIAIVVNFYRQYKKSKEDDEPIDIDKIISSSKARKIDDKSIFQVAIEGQHFGTALELVTLFKNQKQAYEIRRLKDKNKMTALGSLASLPASFKSGSKLDWFDELLYKYCVSIEDDDITTQELFGDIDANGHELSAPQSMGLENQNAKVPRSYVQEVMNWMHRKLRKGTHLVLSNEKRKHTLAAKLAKILIKVTIWGDESGGSEAPSDGLSAEVKDDSNRPNLSGDDIDETLKTEPSYEKKEPNLSGDDFDDTPKTQPSHGKKDPNRTKEMVQSPSQNKEQDSSFQRDDIGGNSVKEKQKNTEQPSQEGDQTATKNLSQNFLVDDQFRDPRLVFTGDRVPLFKAAMLGIEEIVQGIIDEYPQAVEYVNNKDTNILHVVVAYRRKHIFEMLQRQGIPWTRMTRVIDRSGYTLLHHAADMKHYPGSSKPSPAFQLQEELLWFDRVQKVVPSYYAMHRENSQKHYTPFELFNEKHEPQLRKAQEWTKDTSQSCSTVAVLVATVVFAAAYTVPGGTNDRGYPNLLNSSYFLAFTVMDVISLACSLTSVMSFLSILTSPFELEQFRHTIPRKLMFGFGMLFFSVITSLFAFGSTIILVIQSERHIAASLVSIASFFPIFMFGIMQYRLYWAFVIEFLSLIKYVPGSGLLYRFIRRRLKPSS